MLQSLLLQVFYGAQGVVLEASSNKAARLLAGRGQTIHAANKLLPTASLRTVHLRLNNPFDAHYRLAKSYCQKIVALNRGVPRLVGAPCPRREQNAGEDYACWMATLFTPIRCSGPGWCADPLQCCATLGIEDPADASSGAGEPAAPGQRPHSFVPAWRVRRAQMQVLASYALAKCDAAKRIPVFMDTTLCKSWQPSEIILAHSALQRMTLSQAFRQLLGPVLCLQRPIDLVLEAWGVPTGHHPHQLFLAEFCACKNIDVILNMDLVAESRNTAKKTAQQKQAYIGNRTTMAVLKSLRNQGRP